MYVFAKIGHDLNEGLSRPLSETSENKEEKVQTGDRTSYIPNTVQNVTAWAQFIIQNVFHYVTNTPTSKLITRLMAIN